MSNDLKKQSNPFSTGGGGVNFETRVQAVFALSLLKKVCVPCLSQNMRAKAASWSHLVEYNLNIFSSRWLF